MIKNIYSSRPTVKIVYQYVYYDTDGGDDGDDDDDDDT